MRILTVIALPCGRDAGAFAAHKIGLTKCCSLGQNVASNSNDVQSAFISKA